MITNRFHLPVRPYSPIDALNRRAAATGSPGYAFAARAADYNGHLVTLSWNVYRGYYISEHYWGERVVHARGDFAKCLGATLYEYDRGALGASADISPRPDDTEAIDLCLATPELVPGPLPQTGPWWTWRHQAAAESARDVAHPRASVRVFDWELMQAAESLAAYEAAVKAKHGRVWT